MSIKHVAKEYMDTRKMPDLRVMKQRIEPYPYVSFDIFDTILKRNVKRPEHVFAYMEYQIQDIIGNFSNKRIEAERIAREKSNGREISILDIYREFSEINDTYRKKLIELELKVESDVLTANIELKEFFNHCINKGKAVFLISDMYLPTSFFTDVLRREGIYGFKDIYVSCDRKMNKITGDLYKLVLLENEIHENEILHIGDSFVADVKGAKKAGIESFWIPRIVKHDCYQIDDKKRSIEVTSLNSFLNNNSCNEKNHFYKFGFEKYGMLLWGFSKWLADNIKRQHIERVYFFSRDGLIMKKAFDLCNNDSSIRTYYLEVSRRSLRVPVLWKKCEYKDVIQMLSTSRLKTISSIFDGVGLDINGYKEEIHKFGYNEMTFFDCNKLLEDRNFEALFHRIKKDIISNSYNEFLALKDYLKQSGVEGKFAVVDIGWAGGMQRYLSESLSVMGIEHSIEGYYMGVIDRCKKNIEALPEINLNGYLFDFQHDKLAKDTRGGFVGLFESLFMEKRGSVMKYGNLPDSHKMTAVRYPYEYLQEGQISFEGTAIETIQQGALDFIRKINKIQLFQNFTFTPELLFQGIKQTGDKPDKKALDLFAEFSFFDDGEVNKLASPGSVFDYMKNLEMLKHDFLSSRWKIGFMKQIFRIPLPYEYLYRLLKKYG